MDDSDLKLKKHLLVLTCKARRNRKHCSIVFGATVLAVIIALVHLGNVQYTYYAHADTIPEDNSAQVKKLFSGSTQDILAGSDATSQLETKKYGVAFAEDIQGRDEGNFQKRLYEIVGDTPIKEMVPFIAKRDAPVAAFLIAIAKKESSFGVQSPSKGGQTCYNYWGYKGSAGRGTGMGYACFASAQEAVQIVGDRIGQLVEKKRDTPARMVDTWKCGVSCKGDPGAPGWVSTVALYFNQITNSNG